MIVFSRKFPFILWVKKEDVFGYYFAEASDEDKRLAKLAIRELANELNDARTRGDAIQVTVIEHLINTRLSNIQATSTIMAAIITFAGTLLAVYIGYILGNTCGCN